MTGSPGLSMVLYVALGELAVNRFGEPEVGDRRADLRCRDAIQLVGAPRLVAAVVAVDPVVGDIQVAARRVDRQAGRIPQAGGDAFQVRDNRSAVVVVKRDHVERVGQERAADQAAADRDGAGRRHIRRVSVAVQDDVAVAVPMTTPLYCDPMLKITSKYPGCPGVGRTTDA